MKKETRRLFKTKQEIEMEELNKRCKQYKVEFPYKYGYIEINKYDYTRAIKDRIPISAHILTGIVLILAAVNVIPLPFKNLDGLAIFVFFVALASYHIIKGCDLLITYSDRNYNMTERIPVKKHGMDE